MFFTGVGISGKMFAQCRFGIDVGWCAKLGGDACQRYALCVQYFILIGKMRHKKIIWMRAGHKPDWRALEFATTFLQPGRALRRWPIFVAWLPGPAFITEL